MVMPSAMGTSGSPGIRIISPKIGITKPAPAANSKPLTVTSKPVGLPIFFSSSLSDFCVFAIHTGSLSKPRSFIILRSAFAFGE